MSASLPFHTNLHFFVRVKAAGPEIGEIVSLLIAIPRRPFSFHAYSPHFCLCCQFHHDRAQREAGSHQFVDNVPVPLVVGESWDLDFESRVVQTFSWAESQEGQEQAQSFEGGDDSVGFTISLEGPWCVVRRDLYCKPR